MKRFESAKAKAAAKGEDIKLKAGETDDEFRARIHRAASKL